MNFQKNVLPRQMQAFSKMSSNLLPVLGTIAFAFSEPSELQLKIIINEVDYFNVLPTYLNV